MNDHLRILSDVADLAAERPPPRIRREVLARIRATTAGLPVPTDVPAAALPYAAQVAALDALLAGATDRQWRAPTVTGWDVIGLVAHLTAVDAIAAEAVGLPAPPELGAGQDVELRTIAVQRTYAHRPADVHRAWRGQAIALLRWANAAPERLGGMVGYFGLTLSRADVLADRCAETWIHADDIRLAWSGSPQPPDAAQISVLIGAGMRAVAATWAGSESVLVHLRGEGGADFPIGAGAFGAEVSLDALEFCYLIVGRRSPNDVARDVEGDDDLAGSVLATAARLARL